MPLSQPQIWYLLGGIVLLAAAVWSLHRLCLKLEELGYIYYRQRPEGRGSGPAGMLSELDRLARPSIEYVVEARDESRRKTRDEEGDGTDDWRDNSVKAGKINKV